MHHRNVWVRIVETCEWISVKGVDVMVGGWEWGSGGMHALQHVEARRPFVCVLVAPPGGGSVCEVCIKDRGQ